MEQHLVHSRWKVQLEGRWIKTWLSFKKIPNPDFPFVPEEDGYELSKDQAYMDQMCHAIMEGELPTSLANQDPEKLSHARWLTIANAFLRKNYASTTQPSNHFQNIVHAIINF